MSKKVKKLVSSGLKIVSGKPKNKAKVLPIQKETHPRNKSRRTQNVTKTDYRTTHEIAEGGLSTCFEGTWNEMKVAVKVYNSNDKASTDSFVREVKAMQKIKHPHVIQYFAHDTPSRAIIMELGTTTQTLNQIIWQDSHQWPYPNKVSVADQVAVTLKFMHKIGIVHLGLKSPNILVVQEFPPQIKLFDFDTSHIVDTALEGEKVVDLTEVFWTERWTAPERLVQKHLVSQANLAKLDIFAFGIVLYELYVGQMPFNDIESQGVDIIEKYIAGERPKIPNDCPKMYQELVELSWNQDVTKRPNFDWISTTLNAIRGEVGDPILHTNTENTEIFKELVLAVMVGDTTTLLKVPSSDSVIQIEARIRNKFKLKGKFRLDYKDPSLDTFVHFEATAKNEIIKQNIQKILIRVVVLQSSDQPWAVSSDELQGRGWRTMEETTSPYKYKVLKDEKKIYDKKELAKVHQFIQQLNGEHLIDSIKEVHMVHNEKLLRSFEDYHDKLQTRWKSADAIFKVKNWKNEPERKTTYSKLKEFEKKFDWNEGLDVNVVPMLQGTSKEAAPHLAQTGFASVALRDSGFYGTGIYWTSYLDYALYYARATKGQSTDCAVFISFVIPGNAYPVIESPVGKNSLYGKPRMGGYQSHFVLVQGEDGSVKGYPYHLSTRPNATQYDELITFDEAQAVPKYILYFSKSSSEVIRRAEVASLSQESPRSQGSQESPRIHEPLESPRSQDSPRSLDSQKSQEDLSKNSQELSNSL